MMQWRWLGIEGLPHVLMDAEAVSVCLQIRQRHMDALCMMAVFGCLDVLLLSLIR